MTAPRVGRFVDVDQLVVTWLNSQLENQPAGTQPPNRFSGEFVWVASVGGPGAYDTVSLRVDVQSFAPGEPGSNASIDLAGRVHAAMAALDGQTVNGQDVGTVRCPSYPVRQFWSNDVDRSRATYELDLPVL